MYIITLYPQSGPQRFSGVATFKIREGVLWFKTGDPTPKAIRTTLPFLIEGSKDEKET